MRLHRTEEEGCREKEDVSMGIGSAGLEGFALSVGLILAIGPQNAFVMRQGLMRSHVFATCLACSLADAGLIAAGILGVGALVSSIEGAEPIIAVCASAFLVGYGLLRVKSSFNPSAISLEGEGIESLSSTLGAALAITFLNPHVYFDTLLLIGGASTGFGGQDRLAFGIGAATASFVFFFSLGYGAKSLSSVLNRPEAWKFIDRGIAVVMFVIAGLILGPHL
tara:strand:- start:1136 stop:1804 length:669 start_codon:yes stop_codon:yes gene_type:complete